MCHLRIHNRTHTNTPWHQERSSERDCSCTRGGPRRELTTVEVRGAQATRRGASWYTQHRRCERHLLLLLLFNFSCGGFYIVVLGSSSAERYPVITRQLARRPEHAPRSPARAYTCTVVYGRAPCVPRSRQREKRPAT